MQRNRLQHDPWWLGLAATLLLVGGLSLNGALSWLGRPFPGFLVLENRVVASAGLEAWPAARGEIFQHEIVAVEGEPLRSVADLHARVRRAPPGTALRYELRRSERTRELAIATRLFGGSDFLLLFGVYLLNGLALGGTALVLRARRRHDPAARATLPLLVVGALWGLTAMDLYGPYRLFRLHALCEALLFPAALHMALCFPRPTSFVRARPGALAAPYAFAAGLACAYQVGLHDPAVYVTTHLLATSALGLGLGALLLALAVRAFSPLGREVRGYVLGLSVGAALALLLPVCLTVTELLSGGEAPQNAVGFTAFLFPLSLGYTVLRADLGARPPLGRAR